MQEWLNRRRHDANEVREGEERETGDFRTPGSTELLNGQAMWMVKACNGGRTPSKISGMPELFNQLKKKSERSLNKRKRARRKKRKMDDRNDVSQLETETL